MSKQKRNIFVHIIQYNRTSSLQQAKLLAPTWLNVPTSTSTRNIALSENEARTLLYIQHTNLQHHLAQPLDLHDCARNECIELISKWVCLTQLTKKTDDEKKGKKGPTEGHDVALGDGFGLLWGCNPPLACVLRIEVSGSTTDNASGAGTVRHFERDIGRS